VKKRLSSSSLVVTACKPSYCCCFHM